jgi:hypothetical protein
MEINIMVKVVDCRIKYGNLNWETAPEETGRQSLCF